jgi:hypothetical protein
VATSDTSGSNSLGSATIESFSGSAMSTNAVPEVWVYPSVTTR